MKETIQTKMLRELEKGEALLWAGQPHQGLRVRKSERGFILVSYLWGLGALYWEYCALTQGYSWVHSLWGIPFVGIGLYLMAGRFVVDFLKRKHAFYGVTNTRVLIISEFSTRKVTRIPLRDLSTLYYTLEHSRSIGTITFGPMRKTWLGSVYWYGKAPSYPCFDMIDQVKDVYELLCEARRKHLAAH